jgi:hypothetical protein
MKEKGGGDVPWLYKQRGWSTAALTSDEGEQQESERLPSTLAHARPRPVRPLARTGPGPTNGSTEPNRTHPSLEEEEEEGLVGRRGMSHCNAGGRA